MYKWAAQPEPKVARSIKGRPWPGPTFHRVEPSWPVCRGDGPSPVP